MAGIFSDSSIQKANRAMDDLTKKIKNARIVYEDESFQEIMTIDLGHVESGDTITTQVPRAGDIKVS